jgi:hypothetical protein
MKLPIRPWTNRESCDYRANGIEQSAREAERDGFPECAARLFKWAAEVRARRDDPDEPEDAPAQSDLFSITQKDAAE